MAKRPPGETQVVLSRAKEEINVVHTPLLLGGITSEAGPCAEADIQNGKGYMHRNQLPGSVAKGVDGRAAQTNRDIETVEVNA
jgi:hypothetical protein